MNRDRRARERGSVVVEAALLMAPLLMLVMFIVYAGRTSAADSDVESAAAQAARAASLRASSGAAQGAARATAAGNIDDSGVACASLDVDVDTSALVPGGHVTVTVHCSVDLADLSLFALPGHRSFAATSVAVVDTLRGVGP